MRTRMRFPALRRAGAPTSRRRQRGATMVEFAAASPFALLLVLGVIQLGLMYSAKEVVNEAAFLAAREGAVQNARVDAMNGAMVKALIPFYQDLRKGDAARLASAYLSANTDTLCIPLVQCFLRVEKLNPTPAAFDDFGVTSNAMRGRTYIPNDNWEYRTHAQGPTSGMSLQDANALKIKVTYGYELKVPLMKTVFNSVMCGVVNQVRAFSDWNSTGLDTNGDCFNYYSKGRVPIVAYATVQMQTPALKD